jgi:hypothetical protein
MDEREATNLAAAEHVVRLRRALEDGKAEIDRQNAAVTGTREHISDIERWIEEQRTGYDDAA